MLCPTQFLKTVLLVQVENVGVQSRNIGKTIFSVPQFPQSPMHLAKTGLI